MRLTRQIDFGVEGLESRILLSATPMDGVGVERLFDRAAEIPVWEVEMTAPVPALSAEEYQGEGLYEGAAGDLAIFAQLREQVVFIAPGAGEQFETPSVDGAKVITLDAGANALDQILAYLRDAGEVSAIHLLTHGGPGAIILGPDQVLTLETFDSFVAALTEIASHVSEGGDLLVYGCDVASSEAGVSLLHRMAEVTGLNVAASDDATGNAASADWDFEVVIGDPAEASLAIAAAIALQVPASFTLAAPAISGQGSQQVWDGVNARPRSRRTSTFLRLPRSRVPQSTSVPATRAARIDWA